jgi:type II secretory pathway pseudopilin PulG
MIKSRIAGFTLIELAVVLFLVSLVLGGVMTPLATRLEQEGRNNSEEKLKEIKANLIGYALINGHLPCPDCPGDVFDANCGAGTAVSNDGIEDGVDTTPTPISPRDTAADNFNVCAVDVGNVPWVTLGLTEFDVWGNRFVYSVDQTFADNTDGQTGDGCTATTGISFTLCSDGNIDIFEEAAGTNAVAQNVPAIVYSRGANGEVYGGTDVPTSADELENWWTDVDTNFVSTNYNQTTANEFDDMVIWLTTTSLIYKMVNAERLP